MERDCVLHDHCWPGSQNHLPPQRIEGQPQSLQGEGPEEGVIFIFAKDHVRSAYAATVLENGRTLVAHNLRSVG
jgi:hypothetical protein